MFLSWPALLACSSAGLLRINNMLISTKSLRVVEFMKATCNQYHLVTRYTMNTIVPILWHYLRYWLGQTEFDKLCRILHSAGLHWWYTVIHSDKRCHISVAPQKQTQLRPLQYHICKPDEWDIFLTLRLLNLSRRARWWTATSFKTLCIKKAVFRCSCTDSTPHDECVSDEQ